MIQITDKGKCTGCFACLNACPKDCIQMKSDTEGFSYPIVDKSICIRCSRCQQACPVLNIKHVLPIIPEAYACRNLDETVRQLSSSGGMFYSLAVSIICQGGVVFGAHLDERFEVVHSYAEDEEKLKTFRGSKYVQSNLGISYRNAEKFLKQGRTVYFSGTPCQIAGLKVYLGREYENLIYQDLICHGSASPLVWKKYLSWITERESAAVKEINFRSKTNGWTNFTLDIKFDNDRVLREHHNQNLYMRLFLRDVILRPSCYACCFKGWPRQSDLTLADLWGIEQVSNEIKDDDKGVTLLFTNTEKGLQLLNKVQNQVHIEAIDAEKALQYNPSGLESSIKPSIRGDFFKQIDKINFQNVKKFTDLPFSEKVRRKINNAIKKIRKS